MIFRALNAEEPVGALSLIVQSAGSTVSSFAVKSCSPSTGAVTIAIDVASYRGGDGHRLEVCCPEFGSRSFQWVLDDEIEVLVFSLGRSCRAAPRHFAAFNEARYCRPRRPPLGS